MTAPEIACYTAFKQTLEACTVALGYNYDLSGHVYKVAMPPEIGPVESIKASGEWVYVCLALYDDNDDYSEDSDQHSFTLRATGYAGETATRKEESNALARVLNLKHDIRAAIKANRRLNKTCVDCRLFSSQSLAGWPSNGIRYGQTDLAFRVMLME